MSLSAHQLFDYVSRAVLIASVLYAFLPPREILDGFPRAQKYYSLFLLIVLHVAVNLRAKMVARYPSMPPANFYLSQPPKQDAEIPK